MEEAVKSYGLIVERKMKVISEYVGELKSSPEIEYLGWAK